MTDLYREIRVRPVVRYIVTLFEQGDDRNGVAFQNSKALGEFDNADAANSVAAAIWRDMHRTEPPALNANLQFEPARALKIDWLRGPGEPKDAIRWELIEVGRVQVVSPPMTANGAVGAAIVRKSMADNTARQAADDLRCAELSAAAEVEAADRKWEMGLRATAQNHDALSRTKPISMAGNPE